MDCGLFSPCFSVLNIQCTPVGVADRNIIPDDQLTASSTFPAAHPHYGRLNETRESGHWCAQTTQMDEDYLQVDMGAVQSVCAVATQGPILIHTSSYKLQLSIDGKTWNFYKENNNEKVMNYDDDLSF